MPRNRYTPRVRRSERTHTARQEKEVNDIAKLVRRETTVCSGVPIMNMDKVRRSLRFAWKRTYRDLRSSIDPR